MIFVKLFLVLLAVFAVSCSCFWLITGSIECMADARKIDAVTRLLNLRADALEDEKHD